MTDDFTPAPSRPFWPAARKGLALRCPNCGKGKLYRAYLKPVNECSSCGEPWEKVRADDGPAWVTMLIVGHVVGPMLVYFVRKPGISMWGLVAASMIAAIVLCMALLPSVKGAVMALIWSKDVPTS